MRTLFTAAVLALASRSAPAQRLVVGRPPVVYADSLIVMTSRVPAVLRQLDREPRKLWFSYVIVLADQSGKRLGDIPMDSLLRRSLPYTGFTMVAGGAFLYPLGTESTARFEGFKYRLKLDPHETTTMSDSAPVRTGVLLARSPWSAAPTPTDSMDRIISSPDVTLPLDQTVVLGTDTLTGNRAIVVILRAIRDTRTPPGAR
jgi:hypothetical protein